MLYPFPFTSISSPLLERRQNFLDDTYLYPVSYPFVVAFHPNLDLERISLVRNFNQSLNSLNDVSCLSEEMLLYFDPTTATIPHINSETNPPPSIFNVICKYLRQFLVTSFGVATLPIYCNIE